MQSEHSSTSYGPPGASPGGLPAPHENSTQRSGSSPPTAAAIVDLPRLRATFTCHGGPETAAQHQA